MTTETAFCRRTREYIGAMTNTDPTQEQIEALIASATEMEAIEAFEAMPRKSPALDAIRDIEQESFALEPTDLGLFGCTDVNWRTGDEVLDPRALGADYS